MLRPIPSSVKQAEWRAAEVSATLEAVRRSIALAAAATTAVLAAASVQAAPTATAVGRSTFTGLGFDACTAPSLPALGAWLASPYRAVGIYIGGTNRACGDGNLSASWVDSATSGGWSLFPLYVGLQAPCVTQKGLTRIDPASAAAEGTSAATDAASRAQFFGLEPGVPIYFDMESYATNDPACTQAVQQFVSAWVSQLHVLGYVAGVYGSAASMMRDMVPLVSSGTPPDQIDIGNWNGKQGVFGDPYVPDGDWGNHQRIHQYRGGHDETWGGVTINVDDDYLDGAVAGVSAPPLGGGGGQTPAGTSASSDGRVAVSWPAGTFAQEPTVELTASALAQVEGGFAAGSYVIQLGVTVGSAAVSGFSSPLTLHFTPATPGVVPAFSPDGSSWTVLLQLPRKRLPAGATAGYWLEQDGTVTVATRSAGFFGLLRDVASPSRPTGISGSVVHGALALHWRPSTDNSGLIATYEITRGGTPVMSVPGTSAEASVRALDPGGHSVFRVVAIDGAGNLSTASPALVVARKTRPAGAPSAIPSWAWSLLRWQQAGRSGPKPAAPRPFPRWYWHWASWVLQPYRITSAG